MRRNFQVLALLTLAVCLAAPIQLFLGSWSEDLYRTVLLAGTVGWFVFATAAISIKRG